MTAEEIRGLLNGYVAQDLGDELLDKLRDYLELLLKWNAKTNLTAVRDPEQIMRRHFGESLVAAEWLRSSFDLTGRELYDLGSGAGFPGAPIALWCPELKVTLIESQGEKAAFLREVVRTLNLSNCDVFAGRAEEVSARANFVTMRAVERSGSMRSVAERLLVPRGTLVAMLGANQNFEGAVTEIAGGVRIGVSVMK